MTRPGVGRGRLLFTLLVLLLLGSVGAWWALGAALEASPEPVGPPARAARVTTRVAPEGVTSVRVVDDLGRPVPDLPIWEGRAVTTTHTGDDDVSRPTNAGTRLGVTDAHGIFVPERFPVTVNVAPWPALPDAVTVENDGGEHLLTVARPCAVALTWDTPADATIVDIALGEQAGAPIATGHANLVVPCGDTWIASRGHDVPRVEPEPANFDSATGAVHVRWLERDNIRVCVTDEEGARVPDAVVEGAWQDGECWRYPYQECARGRADGFLGANLCPEFGLFGGFVQSSYDLALERGVPVAVWCDDGSGPGACPGRLGVLTCVSDATPDVGTCARDPDWACTCPDAPDARVVAQAGPYSGESAPVRSGVATFTHTGTASLTVPGTERCGELLLRVDRGVELLIGKLACRDGNAVREHLVAGTYLLFSATAGGSFGMFRWTSIHVADGEAKVFDAAFPSGHPVAVEWVGTTAESIVTVVHTPGYEAMFFHLPTEAPTLVPPGATLWVCSNDDGCCKYDDPGPTVSCAPSAWVLPPMPGTSLF
ncbi:MAG: hypothetical protein V4850_28735 [Myxococcota bacterium]